VKLFLHIGYSKTGTTFLQKEFFPRLKQVNYLGKYYKKNSKKNLIIKKLLHEILLLSNKEFDLKINQLKDKINLLDFHKKKPNLISNEAILTGIISGSYKKAEIKRTIKRLKLITREKNIEIYIMIVIRNHYDLILSLYNALNVKFRLNFNKPLFYKNFNYVIKKNKSVLNILKFHRIYHEILKLVGKNKCKVFFYEEIFSNHKNFKRDFFNYLGLNKNISKINFNKKINVTSQKEIKKFNILFDYLSSVPKKILENSIFLWPKIFFNLLIIIFNLLLNKNLIFTKLDIKHQKKAINKYFKQDLNSFKNKAIKNKLIKYKYLS